MANGSCGRECRKGLSSLESRKSVDKGFSKGVSDGGFVQIGEREWMDMETGVVYRDTRESFKKGLTYIGGKVGETLLGRNR